jgi:hypothetical protein
LHLRTLAAKLGMHAVCQEELADDASSQRSAISLSEHAWHMRMKDLQLAKELLQQRIPHDSDRDEIAHLLPVAEAMLKLEQVVLRKPGVQQVISDLSLIYQPYS